MNKLKKGFTLVELIVVITILAILGTIVFLAFQGYSASARDSKRISDMNTIKTSLELFGLNSGKFPDPASPVMITYSSGSINNLNLRQQGIFGQQNVINVSSAGKLDRLPKDPLTEIEYTYSVTLNKKEFELGTILENDEVAFSPVNLTNAASKKVVTAFIKGNYNGKILKTSSGSTSYIFAVPSIINSDASLINPKNIIDLINNHLIVYNGFANLPSTYDGPTFEVNGAPNSNFVNVNNILVFEGDTGNLILPDNSTPRIELLEAIKNAYSGTDLAGEGDIKNIVNLEISDPANPTPLEEYLAGLIANNNLGGDLKLVPVPIPGDTSGDNSGINLVCEDMTETNIDNLNELGFEYTKEEWCELAELDLRGTGLAGLVIPNEIGYLTNLEHLLLGENELSSLPSSIGNLSNLIELNLNDNKFISIPNEIGNLTNLENLDLSANELTTLPDTFVNLTKLSELYLDGNKLTTIPNEIFSLNQLGYLSLGNNLLTGITNDIGNLTNLRGLGLNNNSSLGALSYYFENDPIGPDEYSIQGYSTTGDLITISGIGNAYPLEINVSSESCTRVSIFDNTKWESKNPMEFETNDKFIWNSGDNSWDLNPSYTEGTLSAIGGWDTNIYKPEKIKITHNQGTLEDVYICSGGCDWSFYESTLISGDSISLSYNNLYTGINQIRFYGTNPSGTKITNIEFCEGSLEEESELLPCNDINQTVADTLNSSLGFDYTINEWCSLTELNLFDRGLTSIPSEMGYLVNLEALSINNNNLTTIPGELSNLEKLIYLDLSGNPGLSSFNQTFEGDINYGYCLPSIGITIESGDGTFSQGKVRIYDECMVY